MFVKVLARDFSTETQ